MKAQNITGLSCDIDQLDDLPFSFLENNKIKLISAKATLDLRSASAAESIISQVLPKLAKLSKLENRGPSLHLSLGSSSQYDIASSPRALPVAATLITTIARAAAAQGVDIGLSPRDGCWMQRIEDAVRLAMRINRRDVGVIFNAGDWQAVDGDMSLLNERIKLALPKMMAVSWPVRSLSSGEVWQPVTHGGDSMDVQTLSRLLIAGGYQGPVILEPQ